MPTLLRCLAQHMLLLVLLVGLLPAQAWASPSCSNGSLVVSARQASYDLGQCFYYLEDRDHQVSLADILAGEAPAFSQHRGGILSFGYTRSVYWARFDLRLAPREAPSHWVFELALPLVDEATLYVVEDGALVHERSIGYRDDWASRDLAVPNPVFRTELKPDRDIQLYLRISTVNTFRMPVTLWHADAYIQRVSVEEAFRGILFGSLLAILIYNVFVMFSVRQRSYVYYVLYLIFATVFITTEQVHGMQLLETRPALFDKQYLHYHIMLSWLFGLLMTREFLGTQTYAPGLDQVLRISLYGVIVSFVLSLGMPYHVGMQWVVIGSMALCAVVILTTLAAWRQYNRAAGAYFLAWTTALTGFVAYGLMAMGFLPLNILTAYAPQLGLTAQVILFSFALADRIKLVQAEAINWNERALTNLWRYQSLFDNAVEGIFQMSLDRRFITANPAIARILGFRSSHALLKANPDVLDTCFADTRIRQWVVERLESAGAVKGIEARFLDRQGKERWATISLQTVYSESGEPLHLEGTCVDATERHKRYRLERERENERMEKELARNSAAAKSQFLANMSHEIRTPLSAIIGYGETLLDAELPEEEKRRSAETVVSSGRHLLDLVNDILDHSKIDADKLEVDVCKVSLPDLLEEIRAIFEPRAREKGLVFAIICQYPIPDAIETDPTRLRQIIINLCGNALKFTDQGSIDLIVRCDQQRQRLQLEVKDTGIGIKTEQLGRLFDPFAQGSAEVARQYGGTGLGLAISRRLAQLLGGDIQVQSRYGEGSVFTVEVATGDLADARLLQNDQQRLRTTQARSQQPIPRLKGHILLAEDNDVNRKLVSLLVARTGAQLSFAENGAEALEQALKRRFDLILMDIQMPVMNGRDATVALREAGVNTPIVALTANVMVEDIEDYRQAGCTEHMAKPIDRQRFFALLSRYLPADPRAAASKPGGDQEQRALSRLVKQFRESLSPRLVRLQVAFSDGDMDTLRREVHQIKGTAGAMGYGPITEQARAVEACLRASPIDRNALADAFGMLVSLIDQAKLDSGDFAVPALLQGESKQ